MIGTARATYKGGPLAGRAAIVENRFGSGTVVYLATLLDERTFGRILLDTVVAAGVALPFPGVPGHVEWTVRHGTHDEFLFLLNTARAK